MAKKKLVCGRALAVLMSVSLSASLTGFPVMAAGETSADSSGTSAGTDSSSTGEADTSTGETEKKDYQESTTTTSGTDDKGNKTETTTKEETWTETRPDGAGGTQDVDVKQTTTTTTVVENEEETVTEDPVEEKLEIPGDQALENTEDLKTDVSTDLPSGDNQLSVTLTPDQDGNAAGQDSATPGYTAPEDTEQTNTETSYDENTGTTTITTTDKKEENDHTVSTGTNGPVEDDPVVSAPVTTTETKTDTGADGTVTETTIETTTQTTTNTSTTTTTTTDTATTTESERKTVITDWVLNAQLSIGKETSESSTENQTTGNSFDDVKKILSDAGITIPDGLSEAQLANAIKDAQKDAAEGESELVSAIREFLSPDASDGTGSPSAPEATGDNIVVSDVTFTVEEKVSHPESGSSSADEYKTTLSFNVKVTKDDATGELQATVEQDGKIIGTYDLDLDAAKADTGYQQVKLYCDLY